MERGIRLTSLNTRTMITFSTETPTPPMKLQKILKDHFLRLVSGSQYVPGGIVDLMRYFKNYGAIQFDYKNEDGMLIAVSKNFRYGSIVSSGKDANELDKNIKDAILTAFDIPSSYADIANIKREGEAKQQAYAAA